jgi:hypothetical protein
MTNTPNPPDTNGPVFKPAPAGPPASKRAGRYDDLYKWLDANPGEWAVVEGQKTSTIISKWKTQGYEARSVWQGQGRYDLYIRKPVAP